MCFAHVSPVRHALTSSGLSVVNAPFRECVAFPLVSDPNVSVRRIEASFRKRGNSLSGNPCLALLGPGCVFVSWFLLCAGFVSFSVGCSVARGFFFFLVGFRVCLIFIGTCHFRFRACCVYILRPWDACLGRARVCPRRHSRTRAEPRPGSSWSLRISVSSFTS